VNIGNRIKERRKELNMSVEELAKRLNKNRTTVYRYEKGDIENLPIDILDPLAKALETTPAYLMGWDSKPNKDTATVGELLKMMRTNRNMTIEEYSREIGISAEDLRMYESGEKYIPLSVINTIADYYRLSMESFTKGTRKPKGEDNVRLDRFKVWAKKFGGYVFTDEEHIKLVEYAEFLLYKREK
jgi:transcriptional regulator with XRE-family HTH domain